MYKPDDFRRIALSAVGAILLTTIAVGAAVGPARAVETAPAAFAQVAATAQLDA